MAQVLELRHAGSSVDLLAGNLILEENGLSIKTSREKIWETIRLIGSAAGADIRTTKDEINQYIEAARLFDENDVKADPVWWRWQSEGESAKQAVIFDGAAELLTRGPFNTALRPGDGSILELALQRHHQWEATSATQKTSSSISTLGGTHYLGAVGGSSPGRIASLLVLADAPDAVSRYWIGIKPDHLTSGFLNPLWELEDGSLGTDASVVSDGNASGGDMVQVSFSTNEDLVERVHISASDVVVSDYEEFAGRFLALLRCKVSTSDTVALVQLRQGWRGQIGQTETIVTSQIINGQTGYKLIEMGNIKIPVTEHRGTISDSRIADSTLSIWAERVSGSGTLQLDVIGLCPSEHMVTAFYGGTMPDLSGPFFYTSPIDTQYAVVEISGEFGNVEPEFRDWFMPVAGGTLVFFAEDNTSSKLGTTLGYQMNIYPRWKSFRT